MQIIYQVETLEPQPKEPKAYASEVMAYYALLQEMRNQDYNIPEELNRYSPDNFEELILRSEEDYKYCTYPVKLHKMELVPDKYETAVTWHLTDVLYQLFNDERFVTIDNALDILNDLSDNHDATLGVSWMTISIYGENYGNYSFDIDSKTPNEIKSLDDALLFLHEVIVNENVNFHWETDFEDYENEKKEKTYNIVEATLRNRMLERVLNILEWEGDELIAEICNMLTGNWDKVDVQNATDMLINKTYREVN